MSPGRERILRESPVARAVRERAVGNCCRAMGQAYDNAADFMEANDG